MLKIPFFKPNIGATEINEVVETLRGGYPVNGPTTKRFETEFASHLNQKHAVAVNSCTAALHLALEAIGLKAGQAVVVPTMTFAATAEVIHHLGARPIFVDCLLDDYNLDVEDAERKIQSAMIVGLSVVAIIVVHYGGQIGNVAGVQRLAKRYRLKIIEDAAHCLPAHFRSTEADTWQNVGATADISCHSLFAHQAITAGGGGFACTVNDSYAARMRIMAQHGLSRRLLKGHLEDESWKCEIIAPGFEYNMSDIAAAIGIHQLRKADLFHRCRIDLAALYREILEEVEELTLPQSQPNRIHSWLLYVIRLKLDRLRIDRDQFISELAQRGIASSVHWRPMHMQRYYQAAYGYAPQDLPTARSLYMEIVTLPLYPEMTEADVRYVGNSIKEILAQHTRAFVGGLTRSECVMAKTEALS